MRGVTFFFRHLILSSLANHNSQFKLPVLRYFAQRRQRGIILEVEVPHMTHLLEKAFAEAAKLSEDEQDAVARFLLQELKSEREWDKRFAESQSQLDQLAKEALDEQQEGQTRRLNPNKL